LFLSFFLVECLLVPEVGGRQVVVVVAVSYFSPRSRPQVVPTWASTFLSTDFTSAWAGFLDCTAIGVYGGERRGGRRRVKKSGEKRRKGKEKNRNTAL